MFTEQAVFNLTFLAFSVFKDFVNRAWAGHEGCIAFTLRHTVFLIVPQSHPKFTYITSMGITDLAYQTIINHTFLTFAMVIDLINWAGTSLISCWAFAFRNAAFFIKV